MPSKLKGILDSNATEPVYYGHLGTNQECPDYQDVLIFHKVILYDRVSFGTSLWIMLMSLFSGFHYSGLSTVCTTARLYA